MVGGSSPSGRTIMLKLSSKLINKCRSLRSKGLSLDQIVQKTNIPRTTIYKYIKDIPLSNSVKKRIIEKHIKRITAFNKARKGRALRSIPQPKEWTDELILAVSHFMFDGYVSYSKCEYQNRNKYLINRVRYSVEKIFRLDPHDRFYKDTGVHRIGYYNVELSKFILSKTKELRAFIKTASLKQKRIFLRSFFDDEGCVYFWHNNRKIRGYQKNIKILELIKKLLNDFNIVSRIDRKYGEIIISKKENIIKFRDSINFSKGIYINPDRKNSIWKRKLEKREILEKVINSYRN